MVLASDLKDVASSQKKELEGFDYGIPRNQLEELDSSPPRFARILVGVRRCGKSTLMQQIRRKNGGGKYFNFEDPRISGFQAEDFQKLLGALQDAYGESNSYYFDEIQVVDRWEWFVRQLLDSKKQVTVTGSNASLFGQKTGTKLTGRHLDTEVFPFSYKEMLGFYKEPAGGKSFGKYLENGGFPEYLRTGRPEVLQRLFNDILARDIIARRNIRNSAQLKELAIALVSNIGKEFSYHSLKKTLEIPAVQTVIDYASFLQDSFLLFAIQKFDYSYKKRLIGPKKIYAVDTGLAKNLSAAFSEDRGKLLENAAYLELRKRHGQDSVFFYKGVKECDFVVREKNALTQAIQVAYSLDSDNMKRELDGLLEALDKLKLNNGLIITHDQEDELNVNGKKILVKPAWKWMLE
ncbi:AAA family ATPase [Candidatus Micrarchaeota archaeon CG_4_10_14_0_2_um_filter_55_9]|nr:MAG: AAA family ATPase [Candidatus Micrarchaeota archaeon CG1_02_55_41]PIO02590.1 MAG: AAA family ATPase [Candidatus Micrarchaeota archaeon CG09_land_8_20_14_0_10_55_25]PIZ92077.1 MAG: AAA family ATPase [Candidatus Micrarchaeota archaeon CG_4_10_14_0_2_um_filter_55_9]